MKPIIQCSVGLLLSLGLLSCGTEKDTSSSSSWQTSSSSSDPVSEWFVTDSQYVKPMGGYSALSDGFGGTYYESVSYSPDMEFHKKASFTVFEKTLYPELLAGCQVCHDSAYAGQAPLIADSDAELAHEYALTQTNLKVPSKSKLVEHVLVNRHQCPGESCSAAAQRILDAVESWSVGVSHLLDGTPRGIPGGEKVSVERVEEWIAHDRSSLPADDLPFVVYTSLHELHNENLTADDLNIVRVAISKALNSLARFAPEIVNPVDITGHSMVYRFDIRDYWGYNQGVERLLFGGSDDDLAFGSNKYDYLGNPVSSSIKSERYNFTGVTEVDEEHAKRTWQRILHGNVEGGVPVGVLPPNIEGFIGERSSNDAGIFVKMEDLAWVEASQLVYTLTRPDVYNSVMMNPFYADELEENLQVDKSRGMESYDYVISLDAHPVDSRLAFRANRKDGGWYWKTFDVFTGYQDRDAPVSIYDVYADPEGKDIRFPFWANPIPKFVLWNEVKPDNHYYSFIATLGQTADFAGFTPPDTEGCDNIPGAVISFGLCLHYTGLGGAQQSESSAIYNLPNGLQGYYVSGGFNQRLTAGSVNVQRDPRRMGDVGDDIAFMTGFSFTAEGDQNSLVTASMPRLIVGESCFACHGDGLLRMNNDIRDWLDTDTSKLPSGLYGATEWLTDSATVATVRQLYPPKKSINQQIEKDREGYLQALAKIKKDMILGRDKNVYVEPLTWTSEYARDQKYQYAKTREN